MANNRMWLVNTRTGERIYLAKYYPSTGWYTVGDVKNRMDEAFEEADFGHLSPDETVAKNSQVGFGPPHSAAGMYGAEWRLELEEDSDAVRA